MEIHMMYEDESVFITRNMRGEWWYNRSPAGVVCHAGPFYSAQDAIAAVKALPVVISNAFVEQMGGIWER